MATVRVEVEQGLLEGIIGNGVKVWKGIPYARKPIGALRFHPPVPMKKSAGIYHADAFGPVSIQNREIAERLGTPTKNMSEDCLYLNVWAPEKTEKKLPVMVWIHGGAFRSGSGSTPLYDGTKLAASGEVIVVTLNYRLGVFGFLHLAGISKEYTANLGLLDQIAALKWVQENIAVFGGDPNQMTIFGESAGSMSVAALLTMPAAKGLFQKAILQSGASQTIPHKKATEIAEAVLLELGIKENELGKLNSFTADEIVQASEKVTLLYAASGAMPFQPTVDERTLPFQPIDAIANGAAKGIPIIIGTNHDEGHFFYNEQTPLTPEKVIAASLVKRVGEENANQLASYYPKTMDGQAQYMTDFVFWRPSLQLAAAQSTYAPVWMYRFDWHIQGHPMAGKAMHALEIPFVFNNLSYFEKINVQVNNEIKSLADTMQKAWITFAKTGQPNIQHVDWHAYSVYKRSTLIVNSTISLVPDPNSEKRKLIIEDHHQERK